MFTRLIDSQEDRQDLHRMGRHLDCVFMLSAGDDDTLVTIRDGHVTSVAMGPFVMPSYDFRMVAPGDEWQQFLKSEPAPGSNDLFAMLRRGVLTFEGNLHPLMSNLLYFKFLLASLRPERGAA